MQQGSRTRPEHRAAPLIGQPILFATGPFAGRYIRAQLVELQKPDLGRKCGIRDRRPVDPPPVVRLRLFQVHDAHTSAQWEEELVNLSEVENYGFICHVDLFPMPMASAGDSPRTRRLSNQSYERLAIPEHAGSSPFTSLPLTTSPSGSIPFVQAERMYATNQQREVYRGDSGMSSSASMSNSSLQDGPPDTVATYMNGLPVPESRRCTHFVVGTTFSASSCIEYQRVMQLLFIFPDLAVKEDGDYFLRYRAFNTLYNVAGSTPIQILAECVGGPFRVYSTKDFPGLRASTELTKHIANFGLRINSREHERKRRKSSHAAERSSIQRRELRPAHAGPSSYTTDTAPHTGVYGSRRGRGSTF
ncbi:velvet factor-domain-containing protein [Rhodofomes roseus]|uniref:Velvet factor-domain-containing protein n=1 Tax=Rhodofomes roseus TaxID=34475 RepID=A0ABQ8K1C6_9APHY|nr:velvet factor-domain-containing protein [Rhodofomes roseus]KAH9829984.1 velvet factor-domain-containing protein [Rhodofomes roseus]